MDYRHDGRSIQSLPELVQIVSGRYETLATMLREELDEGQIENVFKVLKHLPLLNVSVAVRGWWANTENQSEARVNIRSTGLWKLLLSSSLFLFSFITLLCYY